MQLQHQVAASGAASATRALHASMQQSRCQLLVVRSLHQQVTAHTRHRQCDCGCNCSHGGCDSPGMLGESTTRAASDSIPKSQNQGKVSLHPYLEIPVEPVEVRPLLLRRA